MKITIRKIAEMAGVSRSAVDKVIHNRPGVRESVRQDVLRIIKETGYIPIHQTPSEETEQKLVAVLLPKLNNFYFRELKAGMDQMCAAMPGIHLEYYHCDATDIDGMLDVLDFLHTRAVDLYIIRGVKSSRLKNRLDALQAPVIFIDSAVPGAKSLCFIGEDCYRSGRIAASLLVKTLPSNSNIAVISGSPKVSGHKLRLQGFLDAVHKHNPNTCVVEQLYSQDQSVIAYESACKVLEQYPDLRGICNLAGHSGEVGQAILDMRRQGMVKMVCYNHTEDISALIEKGVVEFSIDLSPARQGQILLETVYHFLINHRQPANTIYTSIAIVMDENIDMTPGGSP